MDDKKIIDTFNKLGGSIKHVCEALGGLKWEQVQKTLERNGIEYVNPRLVITKEIDKKIRDLLKTNMTYAEISRSVELKYATVRRHCREIGINPKKLYKSTDESLYLERIVDLSKKGKCVSEISKSIGITRAVVDKICTKNNICLVNKKAKRVDRDYFTAEIEKLGYIVKKWSYKGNKNTVSAIHVKCGTIRNASHKSFFINRCKKCSFTGTSKDEENIRKIIEDMGFATTRGKIGRKEIDIYIPTVKLGIEYNGLYWHGAARNKDKLKHFKKMKMCRERDIELITIFENDWKQSNKKVVELIKRKLGLNRRSKNTKKFCVLEIDRKCAIDFLEKHSIHRKKGGSLFFGLFFKEKLKGVISVSKTKNTLNINDISVLAEVGERNGYGKLIGFVEEYGVKNKINKITTFSENKWGEGFVYEKLGFNLEREYGPRYGYCEKKDNIIDKTMCQKKDLLKKGAVGSMEDSESALAKTLKLYRIYDCGSKKWTKFIINQ